jgi:ubiquinone/menaquinone biosynthesis C-methylase UbiE
MQALGQKAWKGMGMEGWVAHWYTRTRRNDMDQFRSEAETVAKQLTPGSAVLEVAPGPGFFAIELAKLGTFSITGLDISRTMIEIATRSACQANLKIDFRAGNASQMPFADASFDCVYCSAAFKNFAQPVAALNEMHRVLRSGGQAIIGDLRKGASLSEIDTYVRQSGRTRLEAWMTAWIFRTVLLKRAYTEGDFMAMARQSRFGTCEIEPVSIGLKVRLSKP